MSVRQPTPSPSVKILAQKSCRDISSAALKVTEAKLDQVRATVRAAHPLKVYFLGTLAIAEHMDLEAAVPIAWRFLILRGKRTVASTEITLEDDERGPRWLRTSYDPRQRRQLHTIKRMLSNPEIRKGSYELRFLRIPGLDLSTLLWFQAADGTLDRVVQLGTSHLLRAGWPYSLEKLFSRLRPHAQRRRSPNPTAERRLPEDSSGEPRAGSLVEIQPGTQGRPESNRGEA